MLQKPPTAQPDVIEAGRVMATLDDWRAIMFVMLFIIVFLLLFTMWREWAMQSERKLMRGLATSFAESAGKVADSLADLSTKIAVLSALTARAESYIANTTSNEISHGKSEPEG